MLESSSIELLHCHQLPVMQTSSSGDRGETVIGLRTVFGSTLLECYPIGACEDLDHSALRRFAPLSFVL